jgi:VanZ like family
LSDTQPTLVYRSRLWRVIWLYVLIIYLSLPVMRGVLRYLNEAASKDFVGDMLNALLLVSAGGVLVFAMRSGWFLTAKALVPLGALLIAALQVNIPEERFHFLEYGLLGILVVKTCRSPTLILAGAAALFVAAVGAGDELIQWALPNRVGDWRDVGMNVFAGVMGVWIGVVLFWREASE